MTVRLCAGSNDRPRRRTILVVEDEPFVRQATCNILEHAGFDVLAAVDGHDAMQVYERRKREIDLVMTDMVLPKGSGEQLGQELRARSPEVVVLMTSGYSYGEFATEGLGLRTYFLAKPYCRRTLVDKIEEILAAATMVLPSTQAG